MSFLDVDRSEFEKSLCINKELQEGNESVDSLIESYINSKYNNVPTKSVTPIPGFCVKTHTKKGEKIFINVCHTAELPLPKKYCVPMSIGNEKEVTDKSGKACVAFDVAVNSEFFHVLNPNNEVMMNTIIDAVSNKYELELNINEFHVLKNIKSKGKIDAMNIEQRPLKEEPSSKKPLITEIEPKSDVKKPPKVETLVPEFNLLKIDSPQVYYGSEIDLKNVLSRDEILLDVNEDRIYLLTTGKVKYELQYHFPNHVDVDKCVAEFDPDTQVLTIVAPLQKE